MPGSYPESGSRQRLEKLASYSNQGGGAVCCHINGLSEGRDGLLGSIRYQRLNGLIAVFISRVNVELRLVT
jgi:hypothetical protein